MAGLWGRRRPSRLPSSPLNQRQSVKSLVSSGMRVRRGEQEQVRRLVQEWQSRAFAYYDILGEIKYASQFYARMLAPLELFAAEIDAEGDIVRSENQDAIDALERIQDPGGGRTGLLSAYGRLMFLTGECQLFVSLDKESGEERWEMLSSDELRYEGSGYSRYGAPSLGATEYRNSTMSDDDPSAWVPVDDREAVAYRLWQRHPRYSMLADSTMQGVLDLCEELVLLTRAVRARARSRLAGSGIMVIDERISPAPPEAAPDEDVEEDVFMTMFTEAMTSPMRDEGSPSQVVPLVIRATAPDGGSVADLIHHLQIIDPTQLYPETGLRYECIKRLAIGLDMPPEELLGLTDANHWTAWMVDENTWKAHGQPKAQQLVDDLTSSYFRPYLRQVLGWGDESRRFLISYDATAIINHPDRSKDAKDLYGSRAIGKQALREATGFDETDAPTKEELAEMVGIATRDSSLAWFGTPSPRGGNVEIAPGEVVNATMPSQNGVGPATGAEVETGPPSNQPAPEDVVAALVGRVLGASDLALLRAREAAGNRLLSIAKKDPDVKRRLNGTRTGDVAAFLGRDGVRTLKAPPERELVAGARTLVEDALRLHGITDPGIWQVVADHVEQHAARTLYDKHPRPLPDEFAAYITGLILNGS